MYHSLPTILEEGRKPAKESCQLYFKVWGRLFVQSPRNTTVLSTGDVSKRASDTASFKPQSIDSQSTELHLAEEANATDTSVTKDILHTEGENTERNSTDENSTDNSLLSEEPPLEAIRICREDNRIPFPANKEDFLFQLSRLFDMEENWEIETTIAAIIAFHPPTG